MGGRTNAFNGGIFTDAAPARSEPAHSPIRIEVEFDDDDEPGAEEEEEELARLERAAGMTDSPAERDDMG